MGSQGQQTVNCRTFSSEAVHGCQPRQKGEKTMTRLWAIAFVCVSYDLHLSASCQVWHWQRDRNVRKLHDHSLMRTRELAKAQRDCLNLRACVSVYMVRVNVSVSAFWVHIGQLKESQISSSKVPPIQLTAVIRLPPSLLCRLSTVLWPNWMVFGAQRILTKLLLCGPTHCGFDP